MDPLAANELKLCVAGATDQDFCGPDAFDAGKELGKQIVEHQGILLSGATAGFPTWAAMGAREANGHAIGFSPASTEKEHIDIYQLPTEYFNHIVYTGMGASGTNIILTRSSDAVFIGCGRIGTINEFTIAYEEQKPIGILEGSWNTDEIIAGIIENANLETDKIVKDSDPKALVEKVIELVKKDKAAKQKIAPSAQSHGA
jgi:uncharacterized protein (TIGR00725 family)